MSDALFRLIGDGDRAIGGAIPIPIALTTVTNELLDEGSADFRRLTSIVSDVMAFKEDRIMAAAWRSWPAFTRDILSCLSDDMNLIKENQDGEWEVTEELVPDYTFFIPGTDIGFTPRTKESRARRGQNELVYLQLKRDLQTLQEGVIQKLSQAPDMDVLAKIQLEQGVKLFQEAERVLARKLNLDNQPPKETYYRKHHPRKPYQQGKRIRSGMTRFFREEFWGKYAEDGVWYDMADVARKFEELHPEQPALGRGDLYGSMRKAGRDMVADGVLEMQKVMGDGAWKHQFRKKPHAHPGYGNTAIVAVSPVVTWEGIRKDPKV